MRWPVFVNRRPAGDGRAAKRLVSGWRLPLEALERGAMLSVSSLLDDTDWADRPVPAPMPEVGDVGAMVFDAPIFMGWIESPWSNGESLDIDAHGASSRWTRDLTACTWTEPAIDEVIFSDS